MLFLKNLELIHSGLRDLGALICRFIYWLISIFFELFINLSKVSVLSDNAIKSIYQRVTLILSIIMVFYVTLEFVKYVVEPDKMTDKEKGATKIVPKLIIVVVLIAFVPTIFSYAYKLQNAIIDNQVFSKVILGKYDVEVDQQGRNFAADTLGFFYKFDEEQWPSDETCDGPTCKDVVAMNLESLRLGNGLPNLTYKLNVAGNKPIEGKDNWVPKITFNGIMAILVGGFIAYILIMYVVDVGTRVMQLLFLQIIAPIPIIGYLSPKKDGIFQKWVKQCLTTYLDLFIRLALIYFILFICGILNQEIKNHTLLTGVSNDQEVLIYIVLVLGLLMFAQRAPKMLQDLFPKMGAASGNFGLKPGERFKAAGRVAGFGAGAAVGAAAGLGTGFAQGLKRRQAAKDRGRKGFGQAMAAVGGGLMGAARGTTGGFFRGAYNGAKKGNVVKNSFAGAKKQVASNKQFGNRQENGYTFGHQVSDRVRNLTGFSSRIEELENEKSPIKRRQSAYEKVSKAYNDIASEAEKQVEKGAGRYSGEYESARKKLQNIKEDKDYATKVKSMANNQQYLSRYNAINNRTDLTADEKKVQIKDLQNEMMANGNVNKATFKYAERASQIAARTDLTDDQKLLEMKNALNSVTADQVNEDLQRAEKDIKALKDKAVFDFITNGKYLGLDENGQPIYENNATIDRIRRELQTDLDAYNKEENSNNQLNTSVIYNAMQNGEMFDALIKGSTVKDANGNVIVDYSQKDSNGYKINGISDQISRARNEIEVRNVRQEAIKRETSGSGIGEKKS